ncbi:protein SERAC1 [Colletotrichum spaethianum]|uniref:Protein SERAC1 n=1 Tax=Colletotrichum spaethianum TaxID=700344 RepID=A0AA37ULJ1_9PEZI|nr:protein SERAC1 [Colletotrichum spaethianum]GKT51856.1 protein SERAC1 [Colletotrichum spaethianum]GKT61168.1 NB-ARC and TPR domain protein [Colletotrichum tofieldiae]GKT68844.1 NB-ARC and TPR domain protein [Colletotrichum tofieldiae]
MALSLNLVNSHSIVAVHGLNPRSKKDDDHAWDTWRTPSGPAGRIWLRDDLPQHVPDSRIFLYQYNATAVYGKDRSTFVDKANDLLEDIRLEREDAESRPILFLGHSMGGLLIKQALINAHHNPNYLSIKDATSGLAFFATPHNGGDEKLVNFGSLAAKVAIATGFQKGDDVLEVLKQGSIFSDIMHEHWRHQLLHYNIVSFWGCFDNVVPRESARLGMPGDRENVVELKADHSTVCKFGGAELDQDNLKRVRSNIKDMYKKALQRSELNAVSISIGLESMVDTGLQARLAALQGSHA